MLLVDPFRIASGKNRGQRAVLGVGKGSFPFGHLTLKNWRPIKFGGYNGVVRSNENILVD